MNETLRAQRDVEGLSQQNTPPAGPHASKELTDEEKTPGTGSLPEGSGKEADVGPD